MKRTDLKEKSGISTGSLAKPGMNENITTAVPVKICNAPDCDVSDIMEIIPDKSKPETASTEGGGNSGPQQN